MNLKPDPIVQPFDVSTPSGQMRRYWFVGGFGAGVLGVGAIQHWGMGIPNTWLILGAYVLLAVLMAAKQRGEWDV